jgi:acyl CoA:acetate/3-ketoacid CoA transferase
LAIEENKGRTRKSLRDLRTDDAIGMFFAIGLAIEVIHELGALFEATDEEPAAFGKPRDLTLVFCVSSGDWASGGANRLAQPGLSSGSSAGTGPLYPRIPWLGPTPGAVAVGSRRVASGP